MTMRPERFSGDGRQAARDHRSAWDQFDSEPDFGRGNTFDRPCGAGTPSALVRFRDYGPAPAQPDPVREAGREPVRRETGGFRRALRRLSVMTAVWIFGIAVGAAGIRFLPLEKAAETPLAQNDQNDGEYLVEDLRTEMPPAPVREPAAEPEMPKVAVAAEPVNSASFDSNVPVEVLDTIAAIPPWNPDGDISDRVSAAPVSHETAGAFLPAEPVQVPQIPAAPSRTDAFTAAKPQPSAAMMPDGPEPAAAEPEQRFAPAFERIAENEARPMQNQIEYFEPFETVSYSSESEPALRVTASEDFYNDAYGVDNFSDYLPPHRDEEEIPASGSPFQN